MSDEPSDELRELAREFGHFATQAMTCANCERKDSEIKHLAEQGATLLAENRAKDAEIARLESALDHIIGMCLGIRGIGDIHRFASRALNPEAT